MDIARPSQAKAKLRRRLLIGGLTVLALSAITIAVSRLKPAAPVVERGMVWVDTVKRGEMLRQVRGIGVLIPENVLFVTARTSARVEKVVLRAGALVSEDSVIMELVNPEVVQAAMAAEAALRSAEAEQANLRVRLQSDLLAMEASVAKAKSDYETAKLQAEVNESLFADGLVSALENRRTQVAAEDAEVRLELERKRHTFTKESMGLQLAVKEADVSRVRAEAALRREDMKALTVRAGMSGVLQSMALEVGQQVGPGSVLARVADPSKLRAEIRIPETQAKDVQPGQQAVVDTRNGQIQGQVTRVDPAVQNGTVTVDVSLPGDLPKGARPDLSVDGIVELERLSDVLFVGRPSFGQERSTVDMYHVDADGEGASLVRVKLGRGSVNQMEIVEGLEAGDRVILTDLSQHDNATRLRLR